MSKRIYIGDWDVSNSMRLDGDFVYSPFPIPFEVELLVVGGGGGGGEQYTELGLNGMRGGGGGAGGMVTGSLNVSLNEEWTVTIGNGGVGGDPFDNSTNGSNSSFVSASNQVTAYGGGRGANPRLASNFDGSDGGSGGGAGSQSSNLGQPGLETQGTSNIGTFSYFGEQGGTGGYCGTGQNYSPGGGGGAGSPGTTSGTGCQPVGGSGLSWVDGVTYAKGGGTYTQSAPVANTGNGGKAQLWTEARTAGNGASGIVKLRYRGLVKATGGTITQADGYVYHTFTSNDTFTVISSVDA